MVLVIIQSALTSFFKEIGQLSVKLAETIRAFWLQVKIESTSNYSTFVQLDKFMSE